MAHRILASTTASVSELKKNPMGTVAAGEGFPVAILNRNEPAFYCVPAKAYEALLERLEDLELNAIADARDELLVERLPPPKKPHPVILPASSVRSDRSPRPAGGRPR